MVLPCLVEGLKQAYLLCFEVDALRMGQSHDVISACVVLTLNCTYSNAARDDQSSVPVVSHCKSNDHVISGDTVLLKRLKFCCLYFQTTSIFHNKLFQLCFPPVPDRVKISTDLYNSFVIEIVMLAF